MRVVFKSIVAVELLINAGYVTGINFGDSRKAGEAPNDQCGYNDIQWLIIDNKKGIVIVEGHRCALWAYNIAPAMKILRGLDLKPITYQTSDSRLSWWDTLDGYIKYRAPLWEVLKEVESAKNKFPHSSHTVNLVYAARRAMDRFPLLMERRELTEAKIQASLTKEERRELGIFKRLMGLIYS